MIEKIRDFTTRSYEMNECGLECHKLYIPININEMK